MRVASFALAATLLVVGASAFTQPAYPIPKSGNKTNPLTTEVITKNTIAGMVSLPGKMWDGTFVVNAPGKATEPTEVTGGPWGGVLWNCLVKGKIWGMPCERRDLRDGCFVLAWLHALIGMGLVACCRVHSRLTCQESQHTVACINDVLERCVHNA